LVLHLWSGENEILRLLPYAWIGSQFFFQVFLNSLADDYLMPRRFDYQERVIKVANIPTPAIKVNVRVGLPETNPIGILL